MCINKLDAITIDIEKMQYIAMQIFDRSAHNERLSKYQMHELNKCSSILLDYLQNMLEGTREIITVYCRCLDYLEGWHYNKDKSL